MKHTRFVWIGKLVIWFLKLMGKKARYEPNTITKGESMATTTKAKKAKKKKASKKK